MKTNKWVKWVVGLGGVTVFTTFLQLVNDTETAHQQNDSYRSTAANKTAEFENSTNDETMRQHEQELMSLDWTEGNWDVEYSDEVIIATPKERNYPLPPSENRTRRS
uniref:Uncharacterized protein n=1 Tax=Geobacillus sp. (strain Y4.1MC1) TaxID=581103 RepID=A0A7U4DL50_GEOS0